MIRTGTFFLLAILALVAVAFALDDIPIEGDLTEQNDIEEDMDVAERSYGYCPKVCYKTKKKAWRACYKYPHCKVLFGCKFYHHYKYLKGYFCKNYYGYGYPPKPHKKKAHKKRPYNPYPY